MEVMVTPSPNTMFRQTTTSARSGNSIIIPKPRIHSLSRSLSRSLSTITEDSAHCFDLPPITHMKSAISRRKVSEGVSYALPPDKSRAAVEGQYRTNLRIMFKEPYVSEGKVFDDERLGESCKHHLQPNTVPSLMRPAKRASRSAGDWRLNMDSEKCRMMYSHSAPSRGITGRLTEKADLRPRSTLFLPLKARIPPEAVQLKEEAEKIIQSVQEKETETQDDLIHDSATTVKLKKLSRHFSIFPDLKLQSEASDWSASTDERKASTFGNYATIKAFKPPEKRPLPDELKSERLGLEKCEQIWDWLWNYEVINDFTYFMEICD